MQPAKGAGEPGEPGSWRAAQTAPEKLSAQVSTVWFVNTNLAPYFEGSAVRSAFGQGTYQRGATYARSGRVVQLEVDEDEWVFYTVVIGNDGHRYRTTVALQPDDQPGMFYVESYCACPVGADCARRSWV